MAGMDYERYIWDEGASCVNHERHGLSLSAVYYFDWPASVMDADSGSGERRFVAIGYLEGNPRLHVAAFTWLGSVKRAISMRIASRSERELYDFRKEDYPLTDEEEAAIQAGIAADPDAFELDEEWFARARPAMEVEPEWTKRWMRVRGLLPHEDGSVTERPLITNFEWIERGHGEDAAICAGIAADPDAFELDEEWFKRARPFKEVFPEAYEAWLRSREPYCNDDGSFDTERWDRDLFERIVEDHDMEGAVNTMIGSGANMSDFEDRVADADLNVRLLLPKSREWWMGVRARKRKSNGAEAAAETTARGLDAAPRS